MYAQLIMIVVAQMSPPLLNAYDNITPQVAATRVTECGAGTVTVRSNPDLDSDVLIVAGSAPVSDRQLACIDKAASFYDVELAPSTQPRFDAIREARSAALAASGARKWLEAHNLLNRLPKYEPGATNDAEFGCQAEKLCRTDGAFQARYGPHALSPDWLMQHSIDAKLEDGPLACLLNVAWATGFELGFIGNEQAASE